MMNVSQSAAPNPIYEDDEIVVFWHQGSTPYTLITFSDLIGLASGNRFFADSPVMKNAISCLGFVAKRSNWYPVANVERALVAARDLLEPYGERIVYGGSMGGYGAIRYSSALKATHVIALCPQWSLDPQECRDFNPGFRRFFSSALQGMGIRASHAVGNIFVFYDPDCAVDRGHAKRITDIIPSAQGVLVFNSDHHVTPVFAGTQNLMTLIAAVRDGDVDNVARLANRLRRASVLSVHVLLERAVARHPLLSLRASRNPKAHIDKMKNAVSRFHGPLLRSLIAKGERSVAEAYLRDIGQFPLTPDEVIFLTNLVTAGVTSSVSAEPYNRMSLATNTRE